MTLSCAGFFKALNLNTVSAGKNILSLWTPVIFSHPQVHRLINQNIACLPIISLTNSESLGRGYLFVRPTQNGHLVILLVQKMALGEDNEYTETLQEAFEFTTVHIDVLNELDVVHVYVIFRAHGQFLQPGSG